MYKDKLPNEWNKTDITEMARLIKENPDDKSLKELFLNVFPEYGSPFNRELYQLINAEYVACISKYGSGISFDDFRELIVVHIALKSFGDWNTNYSLATYFHLLTLPNGVVGFHIIKEHNRKLELIITDPISSFTESGPFILPVDEHNYYTDIELGSCINRLLPYLTISKDEILILLFHTNTNLKFKSNLELLNRVTSRSYTLDEIKYIIKIARKKISRNQERILSVLAKKFDIFL